MSWRMLRLCLPRIDPPWASFLTIKAFICTSFRHAGQYIANYSMAGRLTDLGYLPDNTGCSGGAAGLLDFMLGGGRVVPGVAAGNATHMDVGSAAEGEFM